MAQQAPVHPPDRERIERAATHLQEFLRDLLKTGEEAFAESADKRSKIHADLEKLLEPLEPEDQGIVLSALVIETQRRFDEAGSPKVGISGGCAGAEGVGVTATQGNITVKACVTGSLQDGITGGGFEIAGRK